MGKIILTQEEKNRIKTLYEQIIGPTPGPKNKFSTIDMRKLYSTDFSPSEKSLNIIKKYENFEPEEYICPSGKKTIGYGTRLDYCPELKGKKISDEVATAYLKKDIRDKVSPVIKKNVKVPINQNQIDALISLIYNIGTTNFAKSNLLKSLNSGDFSKLKKDWEEFRVSKGKVLGGLVNRRKEELDLFFSKK